MNAKTEGLELIIAINVPYIIGPLAKVLASNTASFSPLANSMRIQNAQCKSNSASVKGK